MHEITENFYYYQRKGRDRKWRENPWGYAFKLFKENVCEVGSFIYMTSVLTIRFYCVEQLRGLGLELVR